VQIIGRNICQNWISSFYSRTTKASKRVKGNRFAKNQIGFKVRAGGSNFSPFWKASSALAD
jgi:hypothetical protein